MTEEGSNFFEENDVVAIKEEPEMEIIDTYEINIENNDAINEIINIKKSPSSPIEQMQNQNAGKPLFECKTCGKQLSSKRSFTNHKLGHNNGMPLKCQYCPKTFAIQSAVAAHERTHTGEKPYECDKCPMRFSYSNSLIRHRLTHMEEKQFPCRLCGRRLGKF